MNTKESGRNNNSSDINLQPLSNCSMPTEKVDFQVKEESNTIDIDELKEKETLIDMEVKTGTCGQCEQRKERKERKIQKMLKCNKWALICSALLNCVLFFIIVAAAIWIWPQISMIVNFKPETGITGTISDTFQQPERIYKPDTTSQVIKKSVTQVPRTAQPAPDTHYDTHMIGTHMVLHSDAVADAAGHIVLWKTPKEHHFTGVAYSNGYFTINVTGYYNFFVTLRLVIRDENKSTAFVQSCIKVDGSDRQKQFCRENKKQTDDTIQMVEPRVFLMKGQRVSFTLSNMELLFKSELFTSFKMFLNN